MELNQVHNNIHNILIQIKQLCKQRNVRLTPQRLELLRLLFQQRYKAISAYHLLYLSRNSTLPHAKPSTIYRALNFFLEQGFVHRIESNNSFMLCKYYFLELSHNFIFLICNHCKQVNEQITKNIEEKLQKIAQSTGFFIFNNIIEVQGLCFKCMNKLNKSIGLP